VASGCKTVGGTSTDACDPAGGNSVANCTYCTNGQPICPCHPALTCPDGTQHGATNCCQADPALRYDRFARAFPKSFSATLCNSSYKDDLVRMVDEVL